MTVPDPSAPVLGSDEDPVRDARLRRLQAELDGHARVGSYLRVDFSRPVRSLADGYPENAVTLVGKITERLLKQLWIHHAVPGTPSGKTLKDLIGGCRPYIRSHRVLDALREIQRLRNRAAHDGYPIADEDGLIAVRRLLDVLNWYTSTGSGALSRHAPRLARDTAAKAEWLSGLYVTLDYRLAGRRELSRHTVYLLFARERGLRTEHVELLLSRDAAEAAREVTAAGPQLLQAGLARLTRLVVLEQHDGSQLPDPLPGDCQVVAYDRFVDTLVDLDRHLADTAATYPSLDGPGLPVAGDLLRVDERSGELAVSAAGDAGGLLGQVAVAGGNMLIVGRPGTGKTTLLKQLVAAPAGDSGRRYRFFFDLSLKDRDESFADFVTRTLAPYMSVEAAYVFPVFCYFTRAGSVLCALDGFDEAVPELTLPGLLALFSEVAQVLSAESAAVLTSRVSFLEDSPQTRSLLDGTSLMSEKLAQQLHARGVDPLRVPRFSVLRLRDDAGGGSFLTMRLRHLTARANGTAAVAGTGSPADLADLLWAHITAVAGHRLLPRTVDYFGLAFLRGVTVFTLIDLVNALGIGAFAGGHVDQGSFRLRELFRAADPAGTALALRHAAYQEVLAAEFLRSAAHRRAALAAATHPRLTEEVREFLYCRSRDGDPLAGPGPSGDCVVPAGIYLVGPGHHLMLRKVRKPVRLDRFPVTVARYKQFLRLAASAGSAQWDHPDTPAGHTHQPRHDRLPVPGYYHDPVYDDHPAVAVSWWSAWAFARSEGKRLPTSLEWEAAARGFDGRLFPWGDDVDFSAVNCADSWSDHPLITYAAWRAERDRGRLRDALPGPVDAHPANTSPFGVRELGGNVWEWTSTVLGDQAVICGGSFDNPYRAVQASSKGTSRRGGASDVTGFRCAQDLA
ncbi:MAG TPA: SUMF1/EgtB/PvdO family nonheme iron enzyme [Streptosporangiaceae bacterium]|nr:SUMF1/EgtB/PvdO family nonheme iron enzyme [Streptosporangiaceae bacterium]